MLSKLQSAVRLVQCLNRTSLQTLTVRLVTQSATQTSAGAATVGPAKIGQKSEAVFTKEKTYGAENYAPIPVAINRGEGIYFFGYKSRACSPSKVTKQVSVSGAIFCIRSFPVLNLQ